MEIELEWNWNKLDSSWKVEGSQNDLKTIWKFNKPKLRNEMEWNWNQLSKVKGSQNDLKTMTKPKHRRVGVNGMELK